MKNERLRQIYDEETSEDEMEEDLISQRNKELHRKRMERLGKVENLHSLRNRWRDSDSEGSDQEEYNR